MNRLCFLLACLAVAGCNTPSKESRMQLVSDLYNSKSKSEHLSKLHPDYKMYLNSVRNVGLDKSVMENILGWDYALNPVRHIADTLLQSDSSVTVIVNVQNDFSRMVGSSGWKSRNTFIFKDDKIFRHMYTPLDDENFRGSLAPAVKWLLENDSTELVEVYDLSTKKIKEQDSLNAIKWVELLNKWKHQQDAAL